MELADFPLGIVRRRAASRDFNKIISGEPLPDKLSIRLVPMVLYWMKVTIDFPCNVIANAWGFG